MVLVVLTGLFIQLHNLIPQLTRLRIHEGRRVMWSDLHKVLGVMGLPFQTLFAFSGAFILLGPLVTDLHGSIGSATHRAEARLASRYEPSEPANPVGEHAPVRSLDELMDIARREGEMEIETVQVRGHGRQDGWLVARGQTKTAPLLATSIGLRERDGKVLWRPSVASDSAYKIVSSWFSGLHYARFAGDFVRLVLALLSVGTAMTIVTGNFLWIAKRPPGDRIAGILDRATTAIGGGILVATAGAFVASRLVPLTWAHHQVATQLSFAGALVACLVAAFVVDRASLDGLWWTQLALAGAGFFGTPIFAARWSSAGMFGRSSERVLGVVAVDVGLVMIGAVLLVVAIAMRDDWLRRAP